MADNVEKKDDQTVTITKTVTEDYNVDELKRERENLVASKQKYLDLADQQDVSIAEIDKKLNAAASVGISFAAPVDEVKDQ